MPTEAHSRVGIEFQSEIKKVVNFVPLLRFPQRDRGVREKCKKDKNENIKTEQKFIVRKKSLREKTTIGGRKHKVNFFKQQRGEII